MIRAAVVLFICALAMSVGAADQASVPSTPAHGPVASFQTSDRCIACHNGLTTASGEDVSIGFDWRASIMANSSRDPYWQASVRRETMDHPAATADIEDECSLCHMPMMRYDAKVARPARRGVRPPAVPRATKTAAAGGRRRVLLGVPPDQRAEARHAARASPAASWSMPRTRAASTRSTVRIESSRDTRGSWDLDRRVHATQAEHIRQSRAVRDLPHADTRRRSDADGKEIGRLPEQVPYQEWLHSDYKDHESCQSCHMPVVPSRCRSRACFGEPREGSRGTSSSAANFFMQRMLNRHRDELDVAALPQELEAAAHADGPVSAGRRPPACRSVSVPSAAAGCRPTSPSRISAGTSSRPRIRRGAPGCTSSCAIAAAGSSFESGALRPDGSIAGNDNDADAATVRAALRGDHQRRPGPDLRGHPRRRRTGRSRPAC